MKKQQCKNRVMARVLADEVLGDMVTGGCFTTLTVETKPGVQDWTSHTEDCDSPET